MKTDLIGINGRLIVPREFFNPRDHHLRGTDFENLIEVAGRICYDSFDQEKSRSSAEYHAHIKEVRHTSVFGHGVITAKVKHADMLRDWCFRFSDEPGWYRYGKYLTCNFRFLERQFKDGREGFENHPPFYDLILNDFEHYAKLQAPLILGSCPLRNIDEFITEDCTCASHNQYWITMLLEMSRSCSHEWVRHGFESAISQRSTRYCDESDFEFIDHPLSIATNQYIFDLAKQQSRIAYGHMFENLKDVLEKQGIDSFTSRKQARGAASRYLPHGLKTQMVFSASIREWKEIFRQRISKSADAEIRMLAEQCRDLIISHNQIPDEIKKYLKGVEK